MATEDLITPEMVEAYRAQHQNPAYGSGGGRRWKARMIYDYLTTHRDEIKTVLDFGAGKQGFAKAAKAQGLHARITSYDPAIKGISVMPEGQFDCVVTTDVLEHVEPTKLDAVLDFCFAKARKLNIHCIALDLTGKYLPDGRDLHLIVESPEWWIAKLAPYGRADTWISGSGNKVTIATWKS